MTTRTPLIWLFLLIALMVAGCAEDPPKHEHGGQPGEMRLVSLTPAVTQMLIDLGLSEHIVGVGQYDPVAPPHARAMGNLYQIDYERLLALRPTHIFIQPERLAGPPDRLVALADRYEWVLRSYWIDTLDQVTEALGGPDGVGEALDMQPEADALAARMETQLQAIATLTAKHPPRRVLMLVSLEPTLTAIGPGTFWDQLLTTAGGVNATDQMSISYPVLGLEQVLTLDPQAIVVFHGHSGGTTGRVDVPKPLSGLPVAAVEEDRVLQLADPAALLPSSSMPRVTAKMALLLHPQLESELSAIIEQHD